MASKRSRVLEIGIASDPKGFKRGLDQIDRRTHQSERTLDRFGRRGAGHLGKLAKAAAGAAAAYVGIAEAKKAVSTTTDLAKATIGLNKNLGISVKVASEWAAVAKVRGVETKALNMSFGTLSKQLDAAAQGSDASVLAFKRLGITQRELQKMNFSQVLGETAEGFKNLPDGAKQTATAMKLFGRGWQTIVPVLRDGREEMQGQLDLADKYGATFGGKSIKEMKKFIASQREAKFATLGLQVAFGTKVAPVLTKIINGFSSLVAALRGDKGLNEGLHEAGDAAKDVGQFIGKPLKAIGEFSLKHPVVLKMAGALVAFGLGLKGIKTVGRLTGLADILGLGRGLGRAGAGAGGGIAGKVVGKAAPVPVFVTNPGFGGGGGGSKVPPVITGGAKTALKAGAGLRWIRVGIAGGVPIMALTYLATTHNEDNPTSAAQARARGGEPAVRAFNRRTTRGTPSAGRPNIPGSVGLDERLAAQEKARLEQSKRLNAGWSASVRRHIGDVTVTQKKYVADSRASFHAAGERLSDLRQRTAEETGRIKRRFGDDTAAGREALARNYRKAADTAKTQMRRTGVVTNQGLKFIRELFIQEMAVYGVPRSQALALEKQNRSRTDAHMPLQGDQPGQHHQLGGVVKRALGGMMVPGQGSGDKVHLQAMVEPGEEVFVLNRNASAMLQQLEQLNRDVPRFQAGGMVRVPGDPNTTGGRDRVARSIAGPVSQWVRRYHADIGYAYDPGGGHVSPGHNVTGTATDVVPGPGGSWDLLEKGLRILVARGLKVLYGTDGIGTPWPNHGRGNHAHIEWGGGGLPSFASKIKAPRVRGSGPLAALAQKGLDRAARAARARSHSVTGSLFGSGTGPGLKFSGATNSARNRRIGIRLAKARGWGGAQFRALDHLWGVDEGSWDENLANLAGSGAYGIAQAKPSSKYPPAGRPGAAPGAAKASAQIRWGLNYIAGRYGDPITAHRFRHRMGWYQRGGLVGLQGGGRLKRGGRPKHGRRALLRAPGHPRRFGGDNTGLPGFGGWGGPLFPLPPGWGGLGGPRDKLKQGPMASFADQIALGAALAALTPGAEDDIGIANTAVTGWRTRLDKALARGDTAGATEAATQLKSWQDTLADLTGATQESSDALRELTDSNKALAESIDEHNRILTSSAAITARELQKAMGDMFSRQLGVVTGNRGRSAGDGVTGARY